jgi:hypothetical protein
MKLVPVLVVLLTPLLVLLSYVRRKRSGASRLLASRPQLDNRAFAERYFGENEARMQLASALRNELAKHLPFRIDGVSPEDRLFDDLWMHQWDHFAPAEFLREVEELYSIQLPDAILGPGTSFRDLVERVEECLTQDNRRDAGGSR